MNIKDYFPIYHTICYTRITAFNLLNAFRIMLSHLKARTFSGRKMESYGTTSWIALSSWGREERRTIKKPIFLWKMQQTTPHSVS